MKPSENANQGRNVDLNGLERLVENVPEARFAGKPHFTSSLGDDTWQRV